MKYTIKYTYEKFPEQNPISLNSEQIKTCFHQTFSSISKSAISNSSLWNSECKLSPPTGIIHVNLHFCLPARIHLQPRVSKMCELFSVTDFPWFLPTAHVTVKIVEASINPIISIRTAFIKERLGKLSQWLTCLILQYSLNPQVLNVKITIQSCLVTRWQDVELNFLFSV